AERLADVLSFDHQRAGSVRRRGVDDRLAGGGAIVAPRLPQRLQVRQPAHVALAPSRNAVAQPVLLGLDLACELVLLAFLFGQNLVAPFFEGAEAEIDTARPAAIEPDGRARQVFEET